MKDNKRLSLLAVLCTLVIALGTIALVACSSAVDADGEPAPEAAAAEPEAVEPEDAVTEADDAEADGAEIADEQEPEAIEHEDADTETDDAEPDDAGAADEQDPSAEPVWALAKETRVYQGGGGEWTETSTYERDEHGNVLKCIQESTNDSVDEYMYEFDRDGYVTVVTSKYGSQGTVSTSYTYEKDESGRALKKIGSDDYCETCTYDEAGNLVERSTESNLFPTLDKDDERQERHLVACIYDSDGFIIEKSTIEYRPQFDLRQETEFEYVCNEDGAITGYVWHAWMLDGNGERVEGSMTYGTGTLEWDENGNVTRSTVEVGGHTNSYSVYSTFEYVQVDDPSLAVRIDAHLKTF